MKDILKRNIKTGLITGIVSLFVMYALVLIRFGYETLSTDPEHRLIMFAFVPAWAIMFGYCGYGLSKQYYKQKIDVLGEDFLNPGQEKLDVWNNYRKLIFSNAFNVVAKVAALGLPVYFIAYLDESKYLKSNLFTLIVLLVVSVTCFILSRYLKRKYQKTDAGKDN